MPTKLLYPIVLSLVLTGYASKAQITSSPFVTKTYTAQDGLPHSYVYAILQDSKGYLWIGTRYGLGRFDGLDFSSINLNDIVNNSVISIIHEDEKGKIWFYAGSGVCSLENGKLSLYENDKSFPLTPVFEEDKDHISWFGTIRGKEIYLLDNYTGLRPDPVPDLGNRYCRRAAITKAGNYYNLMDDIVFADKNGEIQTIRKLVPAFGFIVISGYWNNRLYFYTNKGIYAYANKQIKSLFQEQLAGKHIYSVYRDSKKRFWVATEQEGILISKTGDENEFSYSIKPSHNLISGFYEDREGNMWVAGFEGLIRVQEKAFETLPGNVYPFLTDLNMVVKDKEGTIYFFSETNGYSRWQSGKFTFNPSNALKNHLIDASCRDDKNRFWCISRRNKLILFDQGKTTFISDSVLNAAGDLQPDIVYDGNRKKLWLPGDKLLSGDENGFAVFTGSQGTQVNKPLRIQRMGNGNTIVATAANELLLISPSNEIRKLNTPVSFQPERIYRMFSDSAENIWISYPGIGLVQCRLTNNSSLAIIKRFTAENGLANDFIQSLEFDKQGRLWLSTMAGIAVLDLSNSGTNNVPIYLFGKDQGIQASGLEYGRLLCDSSGDIWYSTQNALMKFRASEMHFNDQPPQISIEKVLLNNKVTDWGIYTDTMKDMFRVPVDPVLNYYDNTLTIAFKAATMTNAEDVQYSYLLSGINNYWSSSSKSNTITFTNLKPGDYIFFVRARTNSLNWSTPALFSFSIRKPYWQQWWFVAILVLAGAGSIYLVYRVRIRQQKKEKKIRDQIASDLHDDLGSTLNSVKVYANAASLKDDNKQYLKQIKENIQEAITSVRDIIWVLDEKRDTVGDLVTRINQFALPLCNANHIQFMQQIDSSVYNNLLGRKEKRNLFMIIKEAINNSIKYARCKTISISVSKENKRLVFQVTDDGIGYDLDKLNEGYGLKNIQSRSAEIHYRVNIFSGNGNGTNIKLTKIRS